MKLKLLAPAVIGVLALSALALSPTIGQTNQNQGNVMAQNENLSVFFTGDSDGEIVPCGCPELDYGGVSRKASFFNKLRDAGWEFLALDAGGIVPFAKMDSQMRIKTEALVKSMATMGYHAIALGDRDLATGPEFTGRMIEWLGQPILASNYQTGLSQEAERIVEIRGKRVGLLAFLDPEVLTGEHDWLQVEPWESQAQRVESLSGRVDVMLALANVRNYARLRDLAKLYPQFHLILGSHRGDLPTDPQREGSTSIMGSPPKGRFLGRSEVSFDAQGKVSRIQGIALPVQEHWGAVEEVDEILAEYYRELRVLITSPEFLAERMGDLQEPLFEYVGNEACKTCHEPQFAQWQQTGHARARETLEADGKDQVPECQTCHSTGSGFRTGFITPATTPNRWQVGCESCHGPGAGHLQDNEAPYGIIVEEACSDCHTDHDSPDFDYETYLPKVTH